MLSVATAALGFSAPAMPASASQLMTRSAAVSMGAKEELATALNPAIGYFDPLGLAEADFWSEGNDATYGFLRAAEIKHGRVAMFAFCGYIAQANGIHFPYILGVAPEV